MMKMTTASTAEEDDGSSHLLSFCLCEINLTGMVLSARVLDMFDRTFVSVLTKSFPHEIFPQLKID